MTEPKSKAPELKANVLPSKGVAFEQIVMKPELVDVAELQPNGCIASDFEINYYLRYIYEGKDDYTSRKKYNANYGIEFLKHSFIALDGEVYAIYNGENKILGRGSYSKAKYAQNVKNKQWVVLKVITDEDEDAFKFVSTEVEILRHTTKFGGYIKDEKNPNKFRLLMFLAKGINLQTFIEHVKRALIRPTAYQILKMAESIVLALKKLHDNKILHRDVKPQNTIADGETLLTSLIDLGFAAFEKNSHITNTQQVGTGNFMAPEIYRRSDSNPDFKRYSYKSDGYALGVTLAEFFHMEVKRHVPKDPDAFSKIRAIESSRLFEQLIPDYEIRQELLKLVRGLTCDNIALRLEPVEVARKIRELFENMDFSYVMDRMVGVLDVSEFLTLSDFAKKEIIRSLHEFDQVILVNNAHAKRSPLEIANIHEELLKHGIQCRDKVCHYDKNLITQKNVLASMQAVLNAEDQLYYYNLCQVSHSRKSTTNLASQNEEKIIYTSRYKKSKHYQAEIRKSYFENKVSDSDLKKVKKIIGDEVARIEKKYKNNPKECKARTTLISQTLALMQKEAPLNYGQLKKHSEKLGKDIANIKRHPYIPLFFQRESQTARLAKNLINVVMPTERRKIKL